jgi:hypothetical protein
MMEDCATIEKGMGKIGAEVTAGNFNQVVRWVQNKDQHAQQIQDTVAAYWLAQRVKAPKAPDSPNDANYAAARDTYRRQLELLHGVTVEAMKCKQTTDVAHVKAIREHLLTFSKTYFKPEDLKHIEQHHGHGHEHGK